jgi:RNA-splicing ligase RtcB
MPHNGAINCASRERQGDRDLWVGPPGATPAFPGQRGVVSSTGNDALILEGVENAEAAWSFYSTAHGAGRLFDRKSQGCQAAAVAARDECLDSLLWSDADRCRLR